MYKLLLYFSFGTVVATEDATPDGNHLIFETLDEAEKYGRSTGVTFEAVGVKDE